MFGIGLKDVVYLLIGSGIGAGVFLFLIKKLYWEKGNAGLVSIPVVGVVYAICWYAPQLFSK